MYVTEAPTTDTYYHRQRSETMLVGSGRFTRIDRNTDLTHPDDSPTMVASFTIWPTPNGALHLFGSLDPLREDSYRQGTIRI